LRENQQKNTERYNGESPYESIGRHFESSNLIYRKGGKSKGAKRRLTFKNALETPVRLTDMDLRSNDSAKGKKKKERTNWRHASVTPEK